jgi:hypothetical protein
MKKIFIIIVLGLFFVSPLSLTSNAQENATDTAETEMNFEDVKGIREEVEKKVRDKIDEIVSKQEKRGWIGTITEITSTGFVIETDQETRTVTLNDEATIINRNRQQITFGDLEESQRVIAMGYLQIDNTLDARRVVIVEQKDKIQKMSIFGTITEKADQDQIMLVKNSEESYELVFGEDATIEIRQDNTTEEADYEDLSTEQKIIAVIVPIDGSTATYQVENLLAVSSPEPTPEPETTESTESADLSPTAKPTTD